MTTAGMLRRAACGLLLMLALSPAQRMGYEMSFEARTSGPINAIYFDQQHGTLWGGSSHHGDDYGIAW